MNRTILTLVAALVASATLMTSGAEACISCNYRPEVADTPVSGQSFKTKKHNYVAVAPKAARKQIAKNVPPPPKKQAAPKRVAIAKAEPVTTKTEPVATTTEAAPANKVAETVEPAADETTAGGTKVAELGCSKFIAAVGTTVTVPCE
jgi:membrane-bound lytic murein transglycosylase B